MKWFEDTIQDKETTRQMYKALAATFIGNLLLAVGKWIAAGQSGSAALHADALNSVSDVLYSLTLIIGLLISIKPADISHPHGHERFEPIVGLCISCSMAWAGIMALSESVSKILGTAVPIEPGMPVLVLIASAAIKCAMFIIIRNIARKISNRALDTAAKDNLMDTLTSAAAALGILLSKFIHTLADPVAGLLLALWILRTAFLAFVENINYLTGHGASKETLNELKAEIESVPGVLSVHQLFAEYVGTKLRLDIHIDLDGDMHLTQVHAIETEIEDKMARRPDIDHVFVHAEPATASPYPTADRQPSEDDFSSRRK